MTQFVFCKKRDRERNNFISPWASSNQSSMGNSSFDGPNFNQFGNSSLGSGMGFNNFNSPNNGGGGANSLLNGFNGLGNNPNMGNNNSFDSLSGNNGPVFGMNNNLGGQGGNFCEILLKSCVFLEVDETMINFTSNLTYWVFFIQAETIWEAMDKMMKGEKRHKSQFQKMYVLISYQDCIF